MSAIVNERGCCANDTLEIPNILGNSSAGTVSGPGPLPADWEPYDAVVAGYPPAPIPDESLGTAMLYSSGTTGQPKGIVRDLPTTGPDEPLPIMLFVRAMFGFRDGMTYLNPAPLYHSAPQASVAAALRMGARRS